MNLIFLLKNNDLTINSFIVKDGERYFKYSIDDIRRKADQIDNVEIADDGDILAVHNTVKIVVLPYNINNTGGLLIEGFNDFETYCRLNNKLEWLDFYNNGGNELPANKISKSSNKIVNIKCTHCGYENKVKLNTFINYKKACKACQNEHHNRLITGVNDLYTVCKNKGFDYILEEFNETNLKPSEVSANSCITKIHWKCRYGHEWITSPSHRLRGQCCPQCSSSQSSRVERIVANWLKSNCVNIIERHKIGGYEFDIDIVDYNILIEFNGERIHTQPEIIEKDKNKAKLAHEIGKKLIVILQRELSFGIVEITHDIEFSVNRKDHINKLCDELIELLDKSGLHIKGYPTNEDIAKATRKTVPFERSILYAYPDIEAIWSPNNMVSPRDIYAKTRNYIKLICSKHNIEYSVRADSLAYTYKNNKGCPICSGSKVVQGVNDLATLEPELMLDWGDNNVSPSELSHHSNVYVNWKCHICGYEWKAMVNNRTGVNRTGCPNCYHKGNLA